MIETVDPNPASAHCFIYAICKQNDDQLGSLVGSVGSVGSSNSVGSTNKSTRDFTSPSNLPGLYNIPPLNPAGPESPYSQFYGRSLCLCIGLMTLARPDSYIAGRKYLPKYLNRVVQTRIESDTVDPFCETIMEVEGPGHTLDQIAYSQAKSWTYNAPMLLCEDTEFVSSCGRLFQDRPPQKQKSHCNSADLNHFTTIIIAADSDHYNLTIRVIKTEQRRAQTKFSAASVTESIMEIDPTINPLPSLIKQALASSAEVFQVYTH